MIELDFREPGECELAFIGLVPDLAGQGHGRWLLAEAVRRAWREGVERVHVHTCSLDHPAALGAYRRAGFTPYKRAIERFPDRGDHESTAFPELAAEGRLRAYRHEGLWLTVNTPKELRRAREHVAEHPEWLS